MKKVIIATGLLLTLFVGGVSAHDNIHNDYNMVKNYYEQKVEGVKTFDDLVELTNHGFDVWHCSSQIGEDNYFRIISPNGTTTEIMDESILID